MSRFAKKQEVSVAIKCQACGDVTDYPLKVFPRGRYKEQGFIMHWCECRGEAKPSVADSLGNTHHKIVGVFVERQIPIKYEEAKKLLGNLADG